MDVLIIEPNTTAQSTKITSAGGTVVDDVVALAIKAGVKKLFLFPHHNPDHDNAKIDTLLAHARNLVAEQKSTLLVEAAMEGVVVELARAEKPAAAI